MVGAGGRRRYCCTTTRRRLRDAASAGNLPRHLAAEKALKGALIARGIAIRKIHDLVELQSSLIYADAEFVSSQDVDVLVPWNIAGRYPADVGDADRETALSTVVAASRIVDGLARRILDAD